jgi:hypothetical protein
MAIVRLPSCHKLLAFLYFILAGFFGRRSDSLWSLVRVLKDVPEELAQRFLDAIGGIRDRLYFVEHDFSRQQQFDIHPIFLHHDRTFPILLCQFLEEPFLNLVVLQVCDLGTGALFDLRGRVFTGCCFSRWLTEFFGEIPPVIAQFNHEACTT